MWKHANNLDINEKVKVAQLSPTLCDPTDYTVHGFLQARILGWVAFPFFRESSQPRDWTRFPYIAGNSLPAEPQGKPKNTGVGILSFSSGSSWPRNQTGVSSIAGAFFTTWAIREALNVNRWMDKYIHFIYTCITEYYWALKKEGGNPAICNHMEEPGGHYAKWNKPDTEGKYCMILFISEI